MADALATATMGPVMILAGGTGGHIFPGLAVAEALRERGWAVHWLGAPGSMEEKLVPPRGFAFEPIQFGGLRGKGPLTLLMLPVRAIRLKSDSETRSRRWRFTHFPFLSCE